MADMLYVILIITRCLNLLMTLSLNLTSRTEIEENIFFFVDNIVQRGLLDDFVRGLIHLIFFQTTLFLAPKAPCYSYSILSKNVTLPPQKKKSCEF